MESKHQPLRPCGCDCATPCPNGKTGSERSCMIPAVDVSLAEPDNPARAPTHRCKICSAMWVWHVGQPTKYDPLGQLGASWSLVSKECGKCCDNVTMGEQIEALPPRVTVDLSTLNSLTDEERERAGLPTAVDKALDQLSLEQRVEILEGKCPYGSDDCFCVSIHRGQFVQLGLVLENQRVISALGEQVRARLRNSIKLIAEDGSMTTQQRLAWAMESHPDRRTPEFMDAFKEAAAKLEGRAAAGAVDPSFGERLVGYSEDDPADIQAVKRYFGNILNTLDHARQGYARDGASEQRGRLVSIAITEAEGACMWAVKALTS